VRITRLTEAVGRRVRQAREARGWTQAQLGAALAEHLGEGWSRPAVSIAESGGRDFRAVELLALALVLGHPVGWFFRPPGDSPVELPGGEVPPHVVNMLGSGPSAANPRAFEEAVEAVTRVLAEHWPAAAIEAPPMAGLPVPGHPDLVVIPAPPGTTVEELAEALDRAIEERDAATTRDTSEKKGGSK